MKVVGLTRKVFLSQLFYEMSVGSQGRGINYLSKSNTHKEAKKHKELKIKKDKKDKKDK